jgi:hypothetical protein
VAQKPSKTTFAEGWHFYWWLWKLEQRRRQTLPGTLLFIALIGLLVGLLKKRNLLPSTALPVTFWISYLFTLFQAIPKSLLDISPESWRWLQVLVPPLGAAGGLIGYTFSWGVGLWGIWWGIGVVLWGYRPEPLSVITAGSLGLVVGLTAFLAALARLSYATAHVLALPLVLMPLLLILFREDALIENLLYLGAALTLSGVLLPFLWEG